MTRRIDIKAAMTVTLLLGVFAVALIRANHWRLPRLGNGWTAIGAGAVISSPEEGVYAMFDAARAGNAQAYFECFSGPLRDQVAATAKEDSAPEFKAYLMRQNSAVQGMAVTITERPSADEVRARVEYVYSDHNEVQNVRLRREGAHWKVISIGAAQAVTPLVLYGTKATD